MNLDSPNIIVLWQGFRSRQRSDRRELRMVSRASGVLRNVARYPSPVCSQCQQIADELVVLIIEAG